MLDFQHPDYSSYQDLLLAMIKRHRKSLVKQCPRPKAVIDHALRGELYKLLYVFDYSNIDMSQFTCPPEERNLMVHENFVKFVNRYNKLYHLHNNGIVKRVGHPLTTDKKLRYMTEQFVETLHNVAIDALEQKSILLKHELKEYNRSSWQHVITNKKNLDKFNRQFWREWARVVKKRVPQR